ncbi:MAG: hypothetical protein ACK49N_01550 [Verrucomicrobiota bacterium]
MNALPKSLRIMPRLHQSERDMPPPATTEKSAVADEAMGRVTTLDATDDEALDALNSGRGIPRKAQIDFRYRPMQTSRSVVEDTSDPFAEPLD